MTFTNSKCSDDHGDKIRALPAISELKKAIDITERTDNPSWDYDLEYKSWSKYAHLILCTCFGILFLESKEEEECWKWKRPPPSSKKRVITRKPEDEVQERRAIRKSQNTSLKEKVLKELCCLLCGKVMILPLTTPCGHNFCKLCLEGAFAGKAFERERTSLGGRSLRSQKNVMKCPSCTNDISEFLRNPQVNRELMEVIEGLQNKTEKENEASGSMETNSDALPGIVENDILNPQDEELKRKKDDSSSLTEQEPRRVRKRTKVDAKDGLPKIDEAGEESNKVEETTNNGIDSPSSPLHVRSDDDSSELAFR
ncbi:RING-type E3 ubiquitin transferase [Sarracenia purpurea var. burkii]